MELHDLEQLEHEAHNARNSGRTQEAIEKYLRCFDARHKRGEHWEAGGHLQMVGVSYKIDNDKAHSLEWLHKSVEYYAEYGIQKGVASAYRDIAVTYEYSNELDAADEWLNKSIAIYKTIQDPGGYGITVSKLGLLRARQERVGEAESLLIQALDILKPVEEKDWFFVATTEWHLGSVYVQQAEYERAIPLFNQSKERFDAHPEDSHSRRLAQCYGITAYCHAKLGHAEEAKGLYEKAQELLSKDFTPSAVQKLRQDVHADEIEQLLGV